MKPIKGQTFSSDVVASYTISDFKIKFEELKGINPDEVLLRFGGRSPEDAYWICTFV